MRTLGIVAFPAIVVGVFSGCAPGGGPNEDDIRNPTSLAINVAYSTVNASVDEVRDFLGPRPGPSNVKAASGYIGESMEYFERFAADERLNQDIYGPVLEVWKKLDASDDPREMYALLNQLDAHMKKFPKPPPVTTIPSQAQ